MVLNKSDLRGSSALVKWLEEPEVLYRELERGGGLISEVAAKVARVLDEYSIAARVPAVSALAMRGMEELYDLLHEVWCTCGDLT